MDPVKAVVLAAGASRRMEGPDKLLLPWHGSTVVGSVAHCLRRSRIEHVVVTRREAAAVAQTVSPSPTVENPLSADGMSTSIRLGASLLEPWQGLMIVLGDMPGLDDGVVKTLATVARNLGPDRIVAPLYEDEADRWGHPVVFGHGFAEALKALCGDHGAKGIVEAHRHALVVVPVEGGLADVDTPEHLPRATYDGHHGPVPRI